MKESEAWDLLGQIIESKLETTNRAQYICFFLNGQLGFWTVIPPEIKNQMMDRFKPHKETDIRLRGFGDANIEPPSWYIQPPSWYQDGDYHSLCNQWRVLFCYAMAWEAWEEEMSAET